MTKVDQILEEAVSLPTDQRFTLAHRILASAEPVFDPSVEAAWDQEIRARISRIDQGETTASPMGEVFARIDSLLAR